MPAIARTKKCYSCKQEKPLYMFGVNRSAKDGKQQYCKDCLRDVRDKHKRKVKRVRKDYICTNQDCWAQDCPHIKPHEHTKECDRHVFGYKDELLCMPCKRIKP